MTSLLTRVTICLGMAAAAGCSSTAAAPDTPTSPPASTAAPTTSAETRADDEDGVGAAPSAPPANAALLAAQTYVRMWARPRLDRDVWYASVRPLATPAYGQLLADTDPAHVPAQVVTGSPQPVSSTTVVLVADVPTNAGAIRVTVVNTAGQWLIATARPAPGRTSS